MEIVSVWLLLVSSLSGLLQGGPKYLLDKSRSKIAFTAVKEEKKQVPGVFQEIDGYFALQKNAEGRDEIQGAILVDLESVDTLNEARDNNLKKLFFETHREPSARWALFELRSVVYTDEVSSPRARSSTGESGPVSQRMALLQGRLKLHGETIELTSPQDDLTVQALENPDGSMRIQLDKSETLDIERLGLKERMIPLMKACSHRELESSVGLQADLLFTPPTRR